MKALRTLFWIVVALFFGALAGIVIGGITLAAGLLMLRDAITGRKTDHQSPIN